MFLQLKLLVIYHHRRAVLPGPAMIASSSLIGTVQMTQKIQESTLDIIFIPAFASSGYLYVVGASARSGKQQ